MAEAREVGFARVERARPLRRIPQAPVRDGDGGHGKHVGMGVRAVDRGPGARIASATPLVGAVGAAVAGGEEYVCARRDEGTGDLVERMVGIGAVVLRGADRRVARAVEQPPAIVDHPPTRRGVHPLHQVRERSDGVREERRPGPRLGPEERIVEDLRVGGPDPNVERHHRAVVGCARARYVARSRRPAARHRNARTIDARVDDGDVHAAARQPRPAERRDAEPSGHVRGGTDRGVAAVRRGERGHGRVGEHADNFGVAVTPQPFDGVVVVRFHAHGVGGHPSDATIAEGARRGSVVPTTAATPHLDRVVGLVEPHARHLHSILEQRPSGPEGALTPSLLQGVVAADQNDATRHGRLSSLCWPQCWGGRPRQFGPGARPLQIGGSLGLLIGSRGAGVYTPGAVA